MLFHCMQTRHRRLLREMEGLQFIVEEQEHREEQLQGRISGDLEWRLARGEIAIETAVEVEGAAVVAAVDYSLVQKFIPLEVTKLAYPSNDNNNSNDPSLIRDNSVLRHGFRSFFRSPLSPTETAVHPDQTSFHMKLYPVQRAIITTTTMPYSDAVGSGTDVTIIRNDTLSSQTKPTFTSELIILPPTEQQQQQLELRVMDGYICSTFTSIVYPPPSVDIDAWLCAMTQRCMKDSSTLGITIISHPDGFLSHVLFFENSGYPLLPAALKRADGAEATGSNAKTLAKCFVGATNNDSSSSSVSLAPSQVDGASSSSSSSSPSSIVRRKYYHLGGGHHEDSSSFDSSEFPASLLKSFPAEVQLVLTQIVVYAG